MAEEFTEGMPTLSVVGLGYIGLPTAIAFAANGWNVTGVDTSRSVVDSINRGVLPFEEEGMEEALQRSLKSGNLHVQTDLEPSDVYIIAVPTPFHPDKSANLSYIQAASETVGKVARYGDLVVLESTSPPGTTEKMRDWVCESSPTGAEGVLFAHAPERVLPGKILTELFTNDRLVGGLGKEATKRAEEVYRTFSTGDVHTTDARTAEMSKLAENSFRDVNIAFANELSIICDRLGINVWELIELSNKHPRVNILQPGPGVGGHCIAVDPWFIVEAAPEDANLIRASRNVNDSKPNWVIAKVRAALEADPDGTVAVLGLAFKPNIDDLRESPAVEIARRLAEQFPSTRFDLVEPHIRELPPVFDSLKNVQLTDTETALSQSSIVLLLVDHSKFDTISKEELLAKTVIDTRGLWAT